MADEVTHSALCHGGPLDGQRVSVGDADGFLAADKAANRAWMYKKQADGSYAICVDHDDSLVYPRGADTGERTLNWDRMPLATDPLPVVSLGDSPEVYAGDPVDDGWNTTEENP